MFTLGNAGDRFSTKDATPSLKSSLRRLSAIRLFDSSSASFRDASGAGRPAAEAFRRTFGTVRAGLGCPIIVGTNVTGGNHRYRDYLQDASQIAASARTSALVPVVRRHQSWLTQVADARLAAAGPGAAAKLRELRPSFVSRYRVAADTIVVGALLVSAHFVVLLAPDTGLTPADSESQRFLTDLWQVSAATVGIALVILLLILETVHRAAEGELVWRHFSKNPLLSRGLAFLLGGIISIGVGSLLLLPSGDRNLPSPPGLDNLLILDSILFLISIVVIFALYRQMFVYMAPDYSRDLARRVLKQAVQRNVVEKLRDNTRNLVMAEECQSLGLRRDRGAPSVGALKPVYAVETGVIADVDLGRLRGFAQRLSPGAAPTASIAGFVGQRLEADATAIGFLRGADDRPEIRQLLVKCFKVERDG